MFCYRRHGHNEGDEPAFTQPLMYRTIARHPTTREIYAERLVEEGVIAEGEAEAMAARFCRPARKRIRGGRRAIARTRPIGSKAPGPGSPRRPATIAAATPPSPIELLREVGRGLTTVPAGFHLNPKIARQLEPSAPRSRPARASTGRPPRRWRSARSAPRARFVRLSGQDSGRGTFSQRHAVLVDQETEERYVPIDHVRAGQAQFEIIDSPLSEAARARVRIRLQPRRAARPGAVGGAVRRFRQWRAGHHRPVHLPPARPSGCAWRARAAAAAWL